MNKKIWQKIGLHIGLHIQIVGPLIVYEIFGSSDGDMFFIVLFITAIIGNLILLASGFYNESK